VLLRFIEQQAALLVALAEPREGCGAAAHLGMSSLSASLKGCVWDPGWFHCCEAWAATAHNTAHNTATCCAVAEKRGHRGCLQERRTTHRVGEHEVVGQREAQHLEANNKVGPAPTGVSLRVGGIPADLSSTPQGL